MEQSKFEIVLINDESEFNPKVASDMCITVDFASCKDGVKDTCALGDYDSDCSGSDYCTIVDVS